MSAETQPDPILPNYNPSSWDVPTLSAEERAILDTEYITFPIAQNQNITFPVSPVAPTLPNGTNTDQVATSGFVQNAITALKSATNTWFGFNIFNGGLSATSITRTGTLTITGTPLALSGTRLDTPMSPNYSYPIASGKIGELITATGTPPSTLTINTPQTCLQFSAGVLAIGTWFISGSLFRTSVATGYIIIALNTTTNSLTGAIVQDTTATVNSIGAGNTINWVVEVPNDTTSYFLIAQTGTAGGWTGDMRAIRIA